MTTATEPLIAYHGSEELKTRIMAQIGAHREADEIAQRAYYNLADGKLKVCAVGCVLHDPQGGHERYPDEVGIPEVLAHLQDDLHEAMPLDDAKEWPARFMGAIRVGADLSKVWPRFAICLMVDEEWGVVNITDDEGIKVICRRVAEGYQRAVDDDPLSHEDAEALARDAWAARAAWAAWAAWPARDAWPAGAAWAVRAAGAAWAAWAARKNARDARDARDARPGGAAWTRASADKLIELIEEVPGA